MLKIIKHHNYLNGLKFSFFEFLFAGAIFIPFALYYLIHGRAWYAALATGIILNCLTVSAVAFVSILKKEKSIGIGRLYKDKEVLGRVRAEFPRLSQETGILSLTILIPYWVFVSVIGNIIFPSGRG